MTYRIEVSASALKALKKIPKKHKNKLAII